MRSKMLAVLALFTLLMTMHPLPVMQAASGQSRHLPILVGPQPVQTAISSPRHDAAIVALPAIQQSLPLRVLKPLPHPSGIATAMAQVPRTLLESAQLSLPQSANQPASFTHALVTTCTVTKPNDSGAGSLRQCLLNAAPGATIDFDPQKFPPTAPVSIILATPLPFITVNGLTIDGSNAGVILDGGIGAITNGLVISHTSNVTIRGLQILHFSIAGIVVTAAASDNTIGGDHKLGAGLLGQGNLLSGNGRAGLWIEGNGTTNNRVLGNYIGTTSNGKQKLGNKGRGVIIAQGASGNWIGGDTPNVGNLISGNAESGIFLAGNGASNNYVVGNYIGTDVSGTQALSNAEAGILIISSNNWIGSDTPGARNLISGNGISGIALEGNGATNNSVIGNYIGTDLSGTQAVSNVGAGVLIIFDASHNWIGGKTASARNLISGNTESGVVIKDSGTTSNTVSGNYIGTNLYGTQAIGNDGAGVLITTGAHNNWIGGDTPNSGNLLSGNGDSGIVLEGNGTTNNYVAGNYIGTDGSGTHAVGNAYSGVILRSGVNHNWIGGKAPGERNLISGNARVGVVIQDSGTTSNTVSGNYIGTDLSGASAMGNGLAGIGILAGASGNIIGGDIDGARNLISGNQGPGIQVEDLGTTNNIIAGNLIGTDVHGTLAITNSVAGVVIVNGANNNRVGGEALGARNLISGNEYYGVVIQTSAVTNSVLGNFIGTDINGINRLGNGQDGVIISDSANGNIIGGETPGASNLISGNDKAGITIVGSSMTQVKGNYIGTDISGTSVISNAEVGIDLLAGANNNTIGGETMNARNLISGNHGPGIQIGKSDTIASDTLSNTISGNYIGTDVTGMHSLGNDKAGVSIINGANNNIIGGEKIGAGNLISGNHLDGVQLINAGTTGNWIIGNLIGTNLLSSGPISNTQNGIHFVNGASQNTIGVSNTIAYNGAAGIAFEDQASQGNHVTRSLIYANQALPIAWIAKQPADGYPAAPTFKPYQPAEKVLSGQVCKQCSVELYVSATANAGGAQYLGDAVADGNGAFSFAMPSGLTSCYLSAFAVNTKQTTSEFSTVLDICALLVTKQFLPLIAR